MGSGAYLPLSVCGRDISPLLCPCLLHLHSQLHPLFGTELMRDYNKQGITMQDLNNLNILLDNLSKKANNLTPILYHTQDVLYHKSMDSFEKEEDAWLNAWKPTKTLKNKKFGKKKILQDTGVLKESIIARNDGVKRVSIGSNLSYAPIHQFGGKAGKGANIP